jgi:hypothetical protein
MGYHRPTLRVKDDQAFGFEPPQSLTHRHGAYAEGLGQGIVAQRRSRIGAVILDYRERDARRMCFSSLPVGLRGKAVWLMTK